MTVLSIREMRAVNERVQDIAAALVYWKGEAARLGLFKTLRALDGASKAFGDKLPNFATTSRAVVDGEGNDVGM